MNEFRINIATLDPPYSTFINDLSRKFSGSHYALISNLGFSIYLNSFQRVFIHPKLEHFLPTPEAIAVVKETDTILKSFIEKKLKRALNEEEIFYQARFVVFFENFLLEKNIGMVWFHNDLRWHHALAIQACKTRKIPYMVTEQGFFRPSTFTIDFKGVNGRSSIPGMFDPSRNYICPRSFKRKKDLSIKTIFMFFLFLTLDHIGRLLRLNLEYPHKTFSIRRYCRIAAQLLWSRKKLARPDQGCDKIILVPLQVGIDSQILNYSDFEDSQDVITQIENAFYSLPISSRQSYKLVFTIHPMEKSVEKYHFHKDSLISEENTHNLLNDCDLVITVNSTVGLAALDRGIPVITLGRSIYSLPGISIQSSAIQLKRDLEEWLSGGLRVDPQLQKNFINFLKSEYQMEGNMRDYDDSTLELTKKKISGYLRSRLGLFQG